MESSRTADQLREHYLIERELADRLRSAPSRDERRRLYGVVYQERSVRISHHPLVARSHDVAQTAEMASPQAQLLRTFVGPSTVFCEIGAGDGAVAHLLAPSVRRSIAFDVTDALAIADDPAIGYEFRVFDGFELSMTGVDLVYSNDVAEHLHPDDFADHAGMILRALVPGGIYICVSPNRLWGPHDISGHFSDVPQGFHLREYTATELGAALRAAGFQRTRIVLSVGGRRIGPLLPLALATVAELVIERLPRRVRKRIGRGLAAVKVIATKA